MITANSKNERGRELQPLCTKPPVKRNKDSRGSLLILGLLMILILAPIPAIIFSPDQTNALAGVGKASGWAVGESEVSIISYEDIVDLVHTTDGGFALAINTKFSVTEDRDILLVKIDMDGRVQWSQTYGQGFVKVNALFQTIDGGYALVGDLYDEGDDGDEHDDDWDDDPWLFKTDTKGNVEWMKTLHVDIVDPYHVVQTKDGGFALAGKIRFADGYIGFLGLAKTDNKGIMEWNQTYKGSENFQEVYDLVQTDDDGFIIVGTTERGWNEDIQLVKTDSNGVMEWTKTYGGIKQDRAFSLIQTKDNGFALLGFTGGISRDDNHFQYRSGITYPWLIKTDSNGAMEWDKSYGGGMEWDMTYGGGRLDSLVQTEDSGFALTGSTNSVATDSENVWLVKTNNIGVMEWNKTYGGTDDDGAVAIFQTSDRGFAIAGSTTTIHYYPESNFWGFETEADAWLMKTDESGNEEWMRAFDGTGDEEWANDLIQTVDGGFVFTGRVGSQDICRMDAWLVKTDGNGIMQWNQTYGGTEEDCTEAVLQTTGGGFVLAGSTSSQGAGKSDAWLIKTDRYGMMEWNQTYGGTEEDGAEAIIQTADGGYALAGFTRSRGAEDSDAWLIKTDRNGTVEWNQTYGEDLDDKAFTLFQLANGSFVLFGYFGHHLEEGRCLMGEYHSDTFDHAWLLVTDKNGVLNQNFIYERPENVKFHDLVISSDDGIVIAGISTSKMDPSSNWWNTIGQNSVFYLRMDETGVYQWNKTMTSAFQMGDLIFTTDGGIILTGFIDVHDGINYQSLVKMDSNGLVQWTSNYTVEIIDINTIIIQTADGGYALAGGVFSHGTGGDSVDARLARIDENGILLWDQAYGTTGGKTGLRWKLDSASPAATSFTSWFIAIITFTIILTFIFIILRILL
ncbi:MAG: hypothetical protein ACXACR_09295 [Candidatus Hodarchaeales archaeon]|jgi:hypothetical protein